MESFTNQADTQTSADPKRLFVYGSFMEGYPNYKEALEGEVISRVPGRVRGLLYHHAGKGYPAMIPGDGWVSGEFIELENFDELILLCDKIEEYYGPGHPDNEYERRVCEVELANGKTSLAWTYWYTCNDLKNYGNFAVPVPSGNWREFTRNESETF